MLACFDCRNLELFIQVSERFDARELRQTASSGLIPGPWDRPDDRSSGVYCPSCGADLGADIDALGLTDDRIDFVKPEEFAVEPVAAELMKLRPDAVWQELTMPAREARWAPTPTSLDAAVVAALRRTGRDRLFTHQVEAIEHALGGAYVVQATSAGSGKSTGLLAPVLHTLLREETATAVALFPLRALANDQLNAIARLGLEPDRWVNDSSFDLILDPDRPPIRVARYDGATYEHEKKDARRHARLLVTTPDSIHASLLRMAARQYGDGTSWSRSSLRI